MSEGTVCRSNRWDGRAPLAWGSAMFLAWAAAACTGSVTGADSPSGTGASTSIPTGNGGSTVAGMPPKGGATGGSSVATTGGGSGGMPGVVVTTNAVCAKPAIGPSLLRRLTHAEYDNAVADLLGDKTGPSAQFPRDTEQGLFDNAATSQTVPIFLAGEYVDAAVKLAQAVAVTDLRTLAGCDYTVANGAACVTTFVSRFGRRAFRRPVTPDEVTRLVAIYNSAGTDKQSGMRAVIAATLSSPHFLFRPEFGAAASPTIPDARTLTPFEIAARLSSLLWLSVPDDVLLDEAAAGRLATRDQVATQARRMLALPRAKTAIAAFYDQWLGLRALDTATKNTAIYNKFDDVLRDSLREETRRFVANVIWTDDAHLSTLLSAPYTFVNAPLAALYGVKGPADAATYMKVSLDATQRVGVLTQGSMLAAYAGSDESSPAKRGKWIRTRMLCTDLPDPPNDVPQLPELPAGISNRARFTMHTAAPQCAGCHSFIDGLGFGLEAYDGIGRFRTVDNGAAVDSSGTVSNTVDIDGAYNGGPELAARLARSTQVRDCAATQWVRFALARTEVADDACSVEAVRKDFATSGGNLKDLMVSLTQTDAFMNYRKAN